MRLLASRDYPVIDYQTMDEFIGRERLFRATDGAFLLHMSSEGKLETQERIIWLTVRDGGWREALDRGQFTTARP
jgi:hypothetical protein